MWFENAIPILFICFFIYGLAKQIQQSALLHKSALPSNSFNKRLLLGNHLFSFAFAGFVILLILNVFLYMGILPQIQSVGNTVSLFSFLFLLLMFVFKFAVIPKDPQHSLRSVPKKP